MRRHTVETEVLGPWSLTTSRAFWEGFRPAALDNQRAGDGIRTVFRVEADWSRAEAEVTQRDHLATISLAGDGDLEAAADPSVPLPGRRRAWLAGRRWPRPRHRRRSGPATRVACVRVPLAVRGRGLVGAVPAHPHRAGRPTPPRPRRPPWRRRSIPGSTSSTLPGPRSARPQDRVPARRRRRRARRAPRRHRTAGR